MMARSAGIPVKAFAVGLQKHPFAYFSLSNNPIRKPEDMIGKTVATQPIAVILLRAMLAKHGIDEKAVKVVSMGADMRLLKTGRVDAVSGWNTNIGPLKVLGKDRVDMMLWDAGVRLYAAVYYATDKQLNDHGEVLTRFLRGTARGWGYVKKNPTAAVNMLIEEYPNMDRASNLEAISPILGYGFNETTRKDGWGTMSRANWQAQIDLYASLGQFKGKIPKVDEVMTTSILDATSGIRKEID